MSDGLVSMRIRTSLPVSLILDPCSAALATEDGTAPKGNNNLEPPKSRQQHDPNSLMDLHNPYGTLSIAEFGHLILHPFPAKQPKNQTQNLAAVEAGRAHTRTTTRRRTKGWRQVILTLFAWLQMQLPPMYFRRVKAIIKKSGISNGDFTLLRHSTHGRFFRMAKMVGGVSLPNIDEIHSMERFRKKWKAFVKQCIEEWKNLNIISALLLR